jgi:hypothetical protein
MTEQINSTVVSDPQSSLTEEQIQVEVKKIQAAVASFCDSHQRYIACPENGQAINDYIASQNLDFASADSYATAYGALSKEGKLRLYDESRLPPPESPKEKTPEVAPPAISALAEQRRARQTLEPGGGSVSNREAFLKAAEKFANKQIPGGPRLRLG